ncbi:hypothetical protein BTW26_03610 [Pediococcus acidilactici]|uniref:hypothetical protein n=1 Tax=Pediococcus acidilactici TaxID=1254 RepID=UPI0009475B18|nr:hypothetical protein [Pediococcus acidilactici]APR28086.1 hypothetical protein BTW26_03335 [Pediococcus acidilactici]APR28131.1 hypothetical protein BTW26_03610 [Pediococcus acidilactici]
MANYNTPLTPNNHGGMGNPHPQYSNVKSYATLTDSTSEGLPWLKIRELNLADPSKGINGTIQRIEMGFSAVDDASDNMPSIVNFGVNLAVNYQGNLVKEGTKSFLHRSFSNKNNYKFNLHIFSKKNTNGSYTVKIYIVAKWAYKRIVIINPWVNVPTDRYVTTPTNPLTAKVPQWQKTDFLFKNIKGAAFISDGDIASDVDGYDDYVVPESRLLTYSRVVDLQASLQIILTRVGNNVTANIHGGAGSDMSGAIGTIPPGYRPTASTGISTFRYDGAGMITPILIANNGTVTLLNNLSSGKLLYGSGSYNTIDDLPGGDE